MKTLTYILLAALLLAVGCDKSGETSADQTTSPAESGQDESASSVPTAKPGPWKVGAFDVRAGESIGALELPDSKTVATWVDATISEVEPLERADSEPIGFVIYQAGVIDGVSGMPADEQPLLRVQVRGLLAAVERPPAVNKLMSFGIARDQKVDAEDGQPSKEKLEAFVKEVVEEYVRIAARRYEALSATEPELVALLQSDELPTEAALTAIHEARDRKVESAVPGIAEMLKHDSPSVVVAAAGALSQMAPEESAGQIIEAAGRLGREREYASLHGLIFIVGDLDQPVAREYLDGLRGHKIPDIRRAAEQALESSADGRRGQP